MWEMIDIKSIGSLNIDQVYSKEYTNETLAEKFKHYVQVSASKGESRIFGLMTLSPSSYGSHFWSGTHIGYDSLGTGEQLTAKEGTSALMCIVNDDNSYGEGINTGFTAAISRGVVHSNTMMDPITMNYHFSAKGEAATVTAGASAGASCGDAEGIYSKGGYSGSVSASGDIRKLDYSVEIDAGQPLSCGPW